MKLPDIAATTGSRAATAKLARQVQKSTVAAGKQPRMNLGILGISIGQKQSTGATSQISESLSYNEVWELLENLGAAIDYDLIQPHFKDTKFDKGIVIDAALQIMKCYGSGDTNDGDNISYALSSINLRARPAAEKLETLVDMQQTLTDHGFIPYPELKILLDSANAFRTQANAIKGNLLMIQETVDFLRSCLMVATTNSTIHAPHKVSFCRATLKKLGILK